MKQEKKALIFNAITNLLNTIIKFCAGVLFSFTPSIADSIFSFSDFITDILDLFELKIANKKPTDHYPFGFGRIEYITNLFTGLLIITIGIGIFLHSFHLEGINVSLWILPFIFLSILIKCISINELENSFKSNKNKTIIMNIEESKLDIFSSIVVVLIVILTQFSDSLLILDKSAMAGSIIISFLIIKSGFELLKENILILIGAVDNNDEYINAIRKEIQKLNIDVGKIELIRYGSYYKVHLILILNPNMRISDAKKIQTLLVKKLKMMKKIKLRFINIDLDVARN